jgi:hypothetical protein
MTSTGGTGSVHGSVDDEGHGQHDQCRGGQLAGGGDTWRDTLEALAEGSGKAIGDRRADHRELGPERAVGNAECRRADEHDHARKPECAADQLCGGDLFVSGEHLRNEYRP